VNLLRKLFGPIYVGGMMPIKSEFLAGELTMAFKCPHHVIDVTAERDYGGLTIENARKLEANARIQRVGILKYNSLVNTVINSAWPNCNTFASMLQKDVHWEAYLSGLSLMPAFGDIWYKRHSDGRVHAENWVYSADSGIWVVEPQNGIWSRDFLDIAEVHNIDIS